jgi:hypothetical protein
MEKVRRGEGDEVRREERKEERGVTHVSPLSNTYQNYLTIVYYLT